MPNTHCLPSGSLGTGELPVAPFPGGAAVNRPGGSVRGVIIEMQGLTTQPAPIYPTAPADILGSILYLTFLNDLTADGWVVIFPPECGLNFATSQSLGLLGDLNNDAGKGSRQQTTVLHWWDHVVRWVQLNLGTNFPIVPFGISWGAWTALTVAINRTSTIAAYGAHIPPVNLFVATPSVLSAGATGYFGTADVSTTVAAGSNGATLPVSTLSVASTAGFPASGPLVIVRGAGGWQTINYTGTSGGNTFTGCSGGNTSNGNLATNDVVQHSTFTSGLDVPYTGLNALGNGFQGTVPPGYIGWETGDIFIGFSAAQTLFNTANGAGAPVTSYAVAGGNHEFDSADVTAAMAWITGTVDPLCPKVL